MSEKKKEKKVAIYDEVEIEDMEFVDEKSSYKYPCPCGDEELSKGIDIAKCPTCSLRIRVIYDKEELEN